MSNSRDQPRQSSSINPYIVEVADAGGEVLKAYASYYLGSILSRQLPSSKKKKADAKLSATLLLMESFIGKLDHDSKVHMKRVYNAAKDKQEQAIEGKFDFFFRARGFHKVSTHALKVAKSYSEQVREAACWAQITQEIANASQVSLAHANQYPDQHATHVQRANPFSDSSSLHSSADSDQVSQLTADVYASDDGLEMTVITATTDGGVETSFVAGLNYDDTNGDDTADLGVSVSAEMEMDISEANIWGGDAADGE